MDYVTDDMDYEDYCEYDYYVGCEDTMSINYFLLKPSQRTYPGFAQLLYAEQLKQKNLLKEKAQKEKEQK